MGLTGRYSRRTALLGFGAIALAGCSASKAPSVDPSLGDAPGYTPQSRQSPKVLLGMGHSYMEGAGASRPAFSPLPLVAAAVGYAPVNKGLGSTDVDVDGAQPAGSNGLARVQPIVASVRPDAALVIYGLNAVDYGNGHTTPEGVHVTPDLYQSDYSRFLQLMRQGMKGPIFCSGIASLVVLSEDFLQPMNAAIEAATRSVAGVTFIDVRGVFSADNFAQFISADGTHPSDAGYVALARRYIDAMRPTLVPATPTA